jgi:hypothetical protein
MPIKMKIENSVKLVLIAALLSCGLSSVAQTAAPQKTAPVPTYDRFQLALSYNATYADQASSSNTFWLTGGSAEVAANVYKALSLAVNVSGLTSYTLPPNTPGLSLITYTAGPRLSWVPQSASKHKVTIFAEGLVGQAHGFNSVFPKVGGATTTANSLALQAGAGLDVALAPHFSLRLVQGGWLRTAMPNSTNNNVQENFQVGAGIVFHSGR